MIPGSIIAGIIINKFDKKCNIIGRIISIYRLLSANHLIKIIFF